MYNIPENQKMVTKAVYEDAKAKVAKGEVRFIYGFATPDGEIAFRLLSQDIVDVVESGEFQLV